MKITREFAKQEAFAMGLESVQIDGIPEGFAFKFPDLTIGDKGHKGKYFAFIPLSDCCLPSRSVMEDTPEKLLREFEQKYE